MSLLKLKIQTSKYYLHQLKVQIYGLTPVVVFAAAVGRYRGGRGAAAADAAGRMPVKATAAERAAAAARRRSCFNHRAEASTEAGSCYCYCCFCRAGSCY